MQRIRSTFGSRLVLSTFASSGVCLLWGLFLAGCGGEDGSGNAFNGENNSAVLAVNCGLGQSPNSLLVKELPVSVVDNSLGIQAVSAYISRESVDTANYSTIMIRVRNSSSQGLAFINAVDIKCLDASGNNLVANLDVHAHGSVGDASGSWVMTCLAGGEYGWVTHYERLAWSQVASIQIDHFEGRNAGIADPPCSLIPYSATDVRSGIHNKLTVSFRNTGSGSGYAQLADSFAVFFDESDRPVFVAHFHEGFPASGLKIEPGETGSMSGTDYYHGPASRIEVHVDFDEGS